MLLGALVCQLIAQAVAAAGLALAREVPKAPAAREGVEAPRRVGQRSLFVLRGQLICWLVAKAVCESPYVAGRPMSPIITRSRIHCFARLSKPSKLPLQADGWRQCNEIQFVPLPRVSLVGQQVCWFVGTLAGWLACWLLAGMSVW